MRIPFAVNSYQHQSLPVSAQRLVNAFPERQPKNAKTPVAIIGVPGITEFASLGAGPVRAMRVMNDVLYVVSGTTLYSVDSSGVATVLGGAVTGTGHVSMSDNGTQIIIVNGEMGYVWAANTGFQLISDTDFNAANTVTFFDSYFVFDEAETNRFFISNANDGTAYTATEFASAETNSDYVVAVINQTQSLLVFGQRTIETFYDAGAVNFPFVRVDGATIERGCAAARSLVKEDNSVFFLGDDRIFYRLSGTSLERVSTHAIEAIWSRYDVVSDCFCFSYTYEGHKFISVIFPAANASWEYDLATGLWHERESWDIHNNSLGRWRANCHAYCYGKNIIGDAFSGKLGEMDGDVFTEFSATMRSIMTSPPIFKDRKRLFCSRFELDVESGVGLIDGQGSDPQVMLDISRDGGRTWVGPQMWVSLGAIGKYLTRLRWLRLGQAHQWVFRITISDPVKRVVIAADADISEGI